MSVASTFHSLATSPIWEGRAGQRHYRLARCLLQHAAIEGEGNDMGWMVQRGLRRIAEDASITSKCGLAQSLRFLVEHGILVVIDPGTPDHRGEQGIAATYLFVNQEGSSVNHHSQFVNQEVVAPTRDPLGVESLYGSGPHTVDGLPPFDPGADPYADEPYLLRWLDLLWLGVIEDHRHSPTRLAADLGISKQGASKMAQRWKEKLYHPPLARTYEAWASWHEAHLNGTEVRQNVITRNVHEQRVRTEALRGTWSRRTARCGRRLFGKKATPPPEPHAWERAWLERVALPTSGPLRPAFRSAWVEAQRQDRKKARLTVVV